MDSLVFSSSSSPHHPGRGDIFNPNQSFRWLIKSMRVRGAEFHYSVLKVQHSWKRIFSLQMGFVLTSFYIFLRISKGSQFSSPCFLSDDDSRVFSEAAVSHPPHLSLPAPRLLKSVFLSISLSCHSSVPRSQSFFFSSHSENSPLYLNALQAGTGSCGQCSTRGEVDLALKMHRIPQSSTLYS